MTRGGEIDTTLIAVLQVMVSFDTSIFCAHPTIGASKMRTVIRATALIWRSFWSLLRRREFLWHVVNRGLGDSHAGAWSVWPRVAARHGLHRAGRRDGGHPRRHRRRAGRSGPGRPRVRRARDRKDDARSASRRARA